MSTDEHDDMQSAPAAPAEEAVPPVAASEKHINIPVVEEEENKEPPPQNPWDEEIEVPEEEIPEEEVPDEKDEPPTTKYNIENTPSNGNVYAATGNQAQLHHTTYHTVTNCYDHLQIILGSQQVLPEKQEENFRTISDLLKQALALARQRSVVPPRKSRPEDVPLPTTHDEFQPGFMSLMNMNSAMLKRLPSYMVRPPAMSRNMRMSFICSIESSKTPPFHRPQKPYLKNCVLRCCLCIIDQKETFRRGHLPLHSALMESNSSIGEMYSRTVHHRFTCNFSIFLPEST